CRLIDYNSTAKSKIPNRKPYEIINNDVAYVYPGTFKNTDLPAAKKLFGNTIGMIIDLRSYPADYLPYTFGNYIKSEKTPYVKFTLGSASNPGYFKFGKTLSNGGNKDNYKNKIVVIVDETTQSAAEFATMAFQSTPNVTVIGSQTAGADGNSSTIVLPGGISTYISGIGVFYPDGKPTQRVGIKIDYVIKPTVRGIIEKKDELLEKALALLKTR
ncbi:MAG: peptidase S41, partial [Pedobacter sp.]